VGGIDHQEELHEIFGGLHGRAYQKYAAATDRFLEGGLKLPIAKFLNDNLTEGLPVNLGYFLGNTTGTADGKYFGLGRQG
jgi:hypothetical protein